MEPRWAEWATQIMAISQNGLTYTQNPFDIERYHKLQLIAADILSSYSSTPQTQIIDLFTGEYGYATPKVDVRAVAFRKDQILLVREMLDHGRWTLPGGWADVGDSPSQAVEREALEETGYVMKAVRLLALYDRNKHPHPPFIHHVYKVFFLCDIVGGSPQTSIETGEVGFFSADAIPELSTGRVTYQQISRFFEYVKHPDWPSDFD
jgi:ADP-ribose pyrophosphatase YjhB (NUDIX family)